jgi:hypothetical protein
MSYKPAPRLVGYWLTPTPSLTPVAKGLMRLDEPVAWMDEAGARWVVPAGFITDGASLPWILTAVWDRWEPRTLRAAIMHDYGYSFHTFGSKSEVDARFYAGLKADHWPHALAYYRAVKLMGWFAWHLQRNVRQG